jgi:hypothetical protein
MRNQLLGIKDITKGTPADPLTGDGRYVEEFTKPTGERTIITNDLEMGKPVQTHSCPADYPEDSCSYKAKLTVMGAKQMEELHAVMGTYTHTADAPVATVNTHQFDLLNILDSPQWKTIAYDERDEVRALEEAVVKSILIELDVVLKITVTFAGTKMAPQSGWTNTVTFDDPVECFVFGAANNYCRMADSDAATLTSSDDQAIEGFTIFIERGHESLAPTIGTETISNFREGPSPICEVELMYPEKDESDNKDFINEHHDQTEKMIEIYLEGSIITGSTPYSLMFQFPAMRLLEPPTTETETPLMTTAKFSMFEALAAPTPMPGVTLPRAVWINTETDLGY